MESLEARLLMAAVRTYDGTGNNVVNPTWGSAGTDLIRLTPAAYADGVSTPAGADRPSARAISNAIAAQTAGEGNAAHLSAFAYLWGQFIDHDLDLTSSASPAESLNVPVPTGDPQFDPNGTGTQVIPLNRSKYDPTTGVTSPRQQVNDITSFLDGSMIYGSNATRDAALRSFAGGKLLTGTGDILPFNTAGLANANDAHIFTSDQLFLAGDVRANENSELTALHTLFLREHNRWADQIAAANPTWTDEQIFQQARRMVIAEVQQITYNEFLPALLGRNALPRYTGYNSNINPSISTEFSTAAFRLGHSMLEDDIQFFDNNGNETADAIPLAMAFFNPSVVETHGIDSMMKYLASTNSNEIDNQIVDSVRNFLFGAPGSGGLDLASLNIQRGRDHGLCDYNTTRAALGLAKVTSFDQITSDPVLAAKLQAVYGSVDNIDLWVGGLAEDHVRGSNVGLTFQRILVDQFTRTRDGDRFWYQRDLSSSELASIRNTKLSDIIKRNSGTTNVQSNVFIFNVTVAGTVFRDGNANGRIDLREGGLGGVTVQLLDDQGEVIDTQTTGRDGRYLLNSNELGAYTVLATLPNGLKFTTASSLAVTATRGMAINRINFGAASTNPPPIVITRPMQPPPPGPQPAGPRPIDPLSPRDGLQPRRDVMGLLA